MPRWIDQPKAEIPTPGADKSYAEEDDRKAPGFSWAAKMQIQNLSLTRNFLDNFYTTA